MEVISFFNIKGGVGKTTLTLLTALHLAQEGKKVLIIDADTQANLTQYLYDFSEPADTIFSAVVNQLSADEVIIPAPNKKYPNVDLIASDISLFKLNEYLSLQTNREKVMLRWFKQNIDILRGYDYIFVDLSPSYDITVRNFIILSDSIITPLRFKDLASIRGCELFYEKLKSDLIDLEIDPEFKRVVVMNYYTTRKMSSATKFLDELEIYDTVRADLLESKIGDSTVIASTISEGISLADYCSKSSKNKEIMGQFEAFISELKERGVL